jgi:hypothetical protein
MRFRKLKIDPRNGSFDSHSQKAKSHSHALVYFTDVNFTDLLMKVWLKKRNYLEDMQ